MLAKRILSALVFAVIAISFVMFKTAGLMVLILLMSMFCVYEINNAFKQGGMKTSPIFGYVFMALMLPAYLWLKEMGVFLLFGICIYLNFCFYILKQKIDEEMLYSNLQFIYPCIIAAFICPILYIDSNLDVGYAIFMSLILNCIATDVFAYFAGVYTGKHKLCPAISPKKTIEGSVGGFLGAVLISLIFWIVWPIILDVKMSFLYMLCLGVVCGIFAQFGDLTASMIKRICGIKDFGNLIPGHGGVMDRVDSIMFCVPVCYMLTYVFKILGGL